MHFPSNEAPSHHNNVSYQASSSSLRNTNNVTVPHRGSLCRVDGDHDIFYVLEIFVEDGTTHELRFQRRDFDFSLRLFAIMDSESRGQVAQCTVREFVTLRCPVFWRRDDDLQSFNADSGNDKASCSVGPGTSSPTFDEVWDAVATCSKSHTLPLNDSLTVELGVEGWMVFCRFIALAQYLEAKRRFSGRHLQQTMRHRNSPRGSEVVVVDVPPIAPPVALSPSQLARYERENSKCLPLPELDLDHSLLAAHDVRRRRKGGLSNRDRVSGAQLRQGHVKINLFGSMPSILAPGSNAGPLEFCLTYSRNDSTDSTGTVRGGSGETIVVRRSMADMKWLNDTFTSHKALGGTLCGRILPPFPGTHGRFSLASQFPGDDTSLTSTGGAIAAAAAGVGIIKQGIKSLWGSYVTSPSSLPSSSSSSIPSSAPQTDRQPNHAPSKQSKKLSSASLVLPESYYNPNSPAGKARQLERYLNYLLGHPALSTSFPLNTILRASQSGLEAAKQCLEEHTRTSKEIKEQTPQMDDGKLLTFWPLYVSGSATSLQPNLCWVRTAAQAAMALKVHGILETTGLPSASARLQHASLPSFDNSRSTGVWSEDEDGGVGTVREVLENVQGFGEGAEESFEEGVLHVRDELEPDAATDDRSSGYDLLPLPVPAPERRILTVGDGTTTGGSRSSGRETRFRYGSPAVRDRLQYEDYDDLNPAFLGEIAVDENIDKLREVIGSVDCTLTRCLASSGGIGRARRETLALHLDIIRGFDSWEGLRGQFVSQRALLKGVSGIEQSRDVFEESDLALIEDISWQTSLASAAVSAAEDVRSTVRAARTAANAKVAASSAAYAAQTACESGKFNSIDEARAAQTRASIAQSHAIHAAVVEHEAKTVKRRATLALAHDVKYWNVHRKREILQTCIAYARSQHEATRRAVDAWSCLRDGYVGSTVIPCASRKSVQQSSRIDIYASTDPAEEVTATIYRDQETLDGSAEPVIVAVEHDLFRQSPVLSPATTDEVTSDKPEKILPLVMASPILDEEAQDTAEDFSASRGSHRIGASNGDGLNIGSHNLSGSRTSTVGTKVGTEDNEVLTSSMQSLVDGLMNWGGQYDSEDDFALPTGMAASIALEESVGVVSQKVE